MQPYLKRQLMGTCVDWEGNFFHETLINRHTLPPPLRKAHRPSYAYTHIPPSALGFGRLDPSRRSSGEHGFADTLQRMPYIDSQGKLVDKRPWSWNPLHYIWAVVNFIYVFFTSMCGRPKAADSASKGGMIRSGGRAGGGAASGAAGGAAKPSGSGRPPSATIRGVSDFKATPCGPSGG
jgi:hypothetical protein